jgi:SHS2 domain-containing protein
MTLTPDGYRFIDHTADFGLEIFGRNPADLFGQAARALTDLLTDPCLLKEQRRRTLEIEGSDWEDLLINWLRELLYLFNGEAQLVAGVDIVSVKQTRLRAKVATEAYRQGHHEIRNEIKAVTYHQLEVKAEDDGWRARVIFDI